MIAAAIASFRHSDILIWERARIEPAVIVIAFGPALGFRRWNCVISAISSPWPKNAALPARPNAFASSSRPLSTQIRQLEVEIGTPLFRRLTRGVELTGAGKLFLEEARNILEHVERAKTEVKRRARGETGQIRIGLAAATYFEPLVNPVRHYPLRRSDASRPHPSRPAAERSGARKPYLPCESG